MSIVAQLAPATQTDVSAESSLTCRNRFETEAPAAWKSLSESLSTVVVSLSEVSDTFHTDRANPDYGKHVTAKTEQKFWVSADGMKLAVDRLDASGKWLRRQVYGVNTDYAFTAEQSVKGGPFYITRCGNDRPTRDAVSESIRADAMLWLHTPFAVDWDSLPEIVRSDGYRLISCGEQTRDGHTFAQVEFEFKPTPIVAGRKPIGVAKAKLLLDPDANWRVVERETRYPTEIDAPHTEISYSPDAGHPADPTRAVMVARIPGRTLNNTVDFSGISHESTPHGEFYLPAIGLPDCPAVSVQRWRLVLVGINLVIVGLILAIVYRRYSRAKAAT